MTVSDIEKAYGLLWRSTSGCKSFNKARKLLLATIGKDGQRRGIDWVCSTVGPMTDNEILQIEEHDDAETYECRQGDNSAGDGQDPPVAAVDVHR